MSSSMYFNKCKCVYLKTASLLSNQHLLKFSDRNFNNLQIVCAKSFSDGRNLQTFDFVVVGAGIVGLSTAFQLKERLPEYNMCVLDKESFVAAHQSSRNSGVIHAGMYYKPGSLRAKLCVEGMHMMYKYLDENKIPYKRNGKLIIAVQKKELPWLDNLYKRAKENKVPGVELLSPQEFKQIEPHMTGLKAMNSPWTGIVEFGEVARHFAKRFKELGGTLYLNYEVVGFDHTSEGDGSTECDVNSYPVTIRAADGRAIRAGFVLTCCGLQADIVAQMTGEDKYPQIMPFRGEYYLMNPSKCHLVKGNVYPVPDPTVPFLGVHFTPKVSGHIWLGPTAMLAYKREGYSWNEIDMKEVISILKFRGFHKFVFKYFRSCIYEVQRSISSKVILKELQMYMPSLNIKDIRPGASVGVQAQAMNKDGTFAEDFVFSEAKNRILHCRNCPSPAATSSLAIGKYVADIVEEHL